MDEDSWRDDDCIAYWAGDADPERDADPDAFKHADGNADAESGTATIRGELSDGLWHSDGVSPGEAAFWVV